MSTTARLKGAAFEREVARIMQVAGWPLAQRTSDGRVQANRGDIANGPAGVHFECKRHEKLNVPHAFDQVVRDASPIDIPVLVHRPSRHDVMATLPLSDLLKLLRVRHRERD